MGIYDELSKLGEDSPTQKASVRGVKRVTKQNRMIDKSTDKSIDQSTDQSTSGSVNQSVDPLSNVDALGAIVERPRAFYITKRVDRWLDEGVRHLKDKGMHKMDRSVLLNALIHNPDLYKPKSLNKIRPRLLAHLTNKSLK